MSTSKAKPPYAIGYAKPPEHARFKAGQSGNPKGRPKGSINLATALNRALKETVVVVENGRRKTITKLDAAVKGMVNRAVKGDGKAMQHMIALGPLVGIEPGGVSAPLDATQSAVMTAFLKRMGLPQAESAAPEQLPTKPPADDDA